MTNEYTNSQKQALDMLSELAVRTHELEFKVGAQNSWQCYEFRVTQINRICDANHARHSSSQSLARAAGRPPLGDRDGGAGGLVQVCFA